MKEIVLKAMGQAINKTVAIAEIIKVAICSPLILLCFSILALCEGLSAFLLI